MDTLVIPPESMLKTSTGTVLEYNWLQSHYATPKGRLLTIQAFVLEIGDLRIMVDPCIGNHKPRQGPAFFNMLNTPFLEYLEEPAFARDHRRSALHAPPSRPCGWNTRLRTENGSRHSPTRAISSAALNSSTPRMTMAEDDETFSDSVQPIMDAGLGQLVEFDHHIADEVSLDGVGPYTRSLLDPHLVGRPRCGRHRRHDPPRHTGLRARHLQHLLFRRRAGAYDAPRLPCEVQRYGSAGAGHALVGSNRHPYTTRR